MYYFKSLKTVLLMPSLIVSFCFFIFILRVVITALRMLKYYIITLLTDIMSFWVILDLKTIYFCDTNLEVGLEEIMRELD